ncbi:Interferon-inducible GTPase 5 [Anabarilius grahami]|uniref:Interferon-inducible GTPase 5 n=1 Tax=Anabarilius grahami TaxID=495550 RepID=A0A3N0Y5C7_ANAGA|nr:Interferon-inducible GTPase 5 [Anabarilius grahami]
MEEKLPNEKVKYLLAPWRFSFRAPGFENRLVAALQLFERFPLDIAVTGGTQEANAQLASAICGPDEEIEEEEWETDDEDDEEEVTDEEEAEDWEEGESVDEEHSIKSKLNHQSSRRKHVRISDHTEFIGSGNPDFDSVLLHRQIPNVRVWTVQGHPSSNSIIKQTNQQYDSTCYDVLVVLTTKQHKEDHMWLKMELHDRDQSFFLVQAERDWDVVEEKPKGPCMTCAWERMRARELELQKRSKEAFGEMADSTDNPSDTAQDPELVKMKDIAKVLAEALPELQKKAFSQFLVAITKELRVPKLLTDDTHFVVSTALKSRKINQDDLDQISKLSQPRDLTDNPSKLQAILVALDHFRLDIGVLGETGCGSSSLVNALLGLEKGDERAASTGVIEITKEAMEYPYPESPKVRLWDLPGLGKISDLDSLSSAPSSSEAQRVASVLALCDVYILVSPLRLRLGALQLLRQVSSLGKECYLVVSMADLIDEKSVAEVRQWAEGVLGKLGLQKSLFLVSAHHPETLDLPKLKETLNLAFPNHTKVALARYVSKQLDGDVFWKRSDSCKFM